MRSIGLRGVAQGASKVSFAGKMMERNQKSQDRSQGEIKKGPQGRREEWGSLRGTERTVGRRRKRRGLHTRRRDLGRNLVAQQTQLG